MNNQNKKYIVTGGAGFIGSHLVKRLREEGFWVRGVDIKFPEFEKTEANNFLIKDLILYMIFWSARNAKILYHSLKIGLIASNVGKNI